MSKKEPTSSASKIVTLDAEELIHFIRGQKVMLNKDLAILYGVQIKVLMQSVNRNIERFPADFMFQLTEDETINLKSQFVTSSWGGRRKLLFAFTEQGVAMLSSVVRSPQAIEKLTQSSPADKKPMGFDLL